jgi:GNAT superfamily N-acetyltransferase
MLDRRENDGLIWKQDQNEAPMNNDSAHQDESNIIIRQASVSDAKVLATLRYNLRSSLKQVSEDEAPFVERCTIWMQERLQNNKFWMCWIAEQEQTAVGNLWAQLIEKIPNPTSEPEYHLYFTNFYVRINCRGIGIGSRLFKSALAWAQTQDVHVAILWPTERSIPFYARNGFSTSADLMEIKIKGGKL